MARNLMIQGTMSGAGKSILTAGILRVLRQDGFRVAPFKSQNMALNSFVTRDGLEMGRAQAVQAAAAGMEPSADMNPILLKPMGDAVSEVIVNGRPIGKMRAADYYRVKRSLVPQILEAYHRLEEQAEIIVIEGAGSPVEINLREGDFVNMGLAQMVDAPVLAVAARRKRAREGPDHQQIQRRCEASRAGAFHVPGVLRYSVCRRCALAEAESGRRGQFVG